MNTNTLRFGVARAAILTVVIAAAALYASGVEAEAVAPAAPATVAAPVVVDADQAAADEAARRERTIAALRAQRVDLIAKVTATALLAPRGFGLAVPAILVTQPTL